MRHVVRLVGLPLLLLCAACAERPEAPSAPAAAPPAAASSAPSAQSAVDYQAALRSPRRPAQDREADAGRKPAEVLAFFDVRPGMTVLDLFSGGGYFTELLSAVVGPTGRVVAHNNSAYLNGLGDRLSQRYDTEPRLANVERVTAENDALQFEQGRFDFVLLSNVYHDVYYADAANGWPPIDGPKLVAELFDSMKPGATLGVIDHAAAPGSPAETGGTVHRIDPEIVKRDFAAAGFVLDGESNVLRNPSDDYTKVVIDPAVRGRTDRFILRFLRP